MFLCDSCHGKGNCTTFHMFKSLGPCESCGQRAICSDCKAHHTKPTPTSQPRRRQ